VTLATAVLLSFLGAKDSPSLASAGDAAPTPPLQTDDLPQFVDPPGNDDVGASPRRRRYGVVAAGADLGTIGGIRHLGAALRIGAGLRPDAPLGTVAAGGELTALAGFDRTVEGLDVWAGLGELTFVGVSGPINAGAGGHLGFTWVRRVTGNGSALFGTTVGAHAFVAVDVFRWERGAVFIRADGSASWCGVGLHRAAALTGVRW
jgi:hypothetical protein